MKDMLGSGVWEVGSGKVVVDCGRMTKTRHLEHWLCVDDTMVWRLECL